MAALDRSGVGGGGGRADDEGHDPSPTPAQNAPAEAVKSRPAQGPAMATGDYFGDLREVDHLLESGPALEALRAATTTLAEHVPPALQEEMERLLPDELREAARDAGRVVPGSLSRFADRFRERASMEREDILHEAAIAVGVVAEMLPAETVDAIREALPGEYGVLFG